MELNQNHRYDHSLNIWASLDLQPSIMYSPNLLIGPHLSPKSKCCWIWRLFLITKVIQNSISRRLRLWGSLALTKNNHSWPFSKQNRKEKLEFYPSCVWTEDFILFQNSPGKQHGLGQNDEILQGEEIKCLWGFVLKGFGIFLVKKIVPGLFFWHVQPFLYQFWYQDSENQWIETSSHRTVCSLPRSP